MGYCEEMQTLQWEIWFAKAYATKEIYKIIVMAIIIMEVRCRCMEVDIIDIMTEAVYTIMILCVICLETYHQQSPIYIQKQLIYPFLLGHFEKLARFARKFFLDGMSSLAFCTNRLRGLYISGIHRTLQLVELLTQSSYLTLSTFYSPALQQFPTLIFINVSNYF